MSKTTAQDPTLEALRVKIRKIMNDQADYIIGGGCDDFAHYRRNTGIIEGLALAERELLDLDEAISGE